MIHQTGIFAWLNHSSCQRAGLLLAGMLIFPLLESAGSTLELTGRSTALLHSGTIGGGVQLRFDLQPIRYPLPAGQNPAYEFIVNPPVNTDKIRYFSGDRTAHVTEIRLFEPGMPFYPEVMSEESSGVGLVNFALNAPVTASSRWANERHESRAVDGSLAFESRWVSGSSRPHWLAIDLQSQRAIGCIQMVSGYLSGSEWLQVAQDFRFEYFKEGGWHEIPGSGRQAGAEPSSMAIILAGSTGAYHLTHRQQENNWQLRFVPTGASAQVLATLSLPAADIREGVGLRMEFWLTRSSVVWMVNGQAVYSFDHNMDESVSIIAECLSADAELRLSAIASESSAASGSAIPADIRIEALGAPAPEFRFHPGLPRQQYALVSDAIHAVRLSVIAAASGQQITIMGAAVNSTTLNTTPDSALIIPVQVISADGSAARTYRIEVTPVPPWDGYELAFADEFDGNQLDLTRWSHRISTRWDSIQRAQNVSVADGRMVIHLEVTPQGQQYTGGVISRDRFQHGYYETRARLWHHPGWHSAFWQMQTSGAVNEIDGFESLYPDRFMTNLQYYRPRHIVGSATHYVDVASDYNVYGWEWLPDRVRFYLNGELIRESDYPGPHTPANVWLSCVAHPNASTADLPGMIEFDYFRYYRPVNPPANNLAGAVIVDTRSPGYSETGEWTASSDAVSHRSDFDTRVSQHAGSTAQWSTVLDSVGWYDVYVWNPYTFRDGPLAEAEFTVTHANGTTQHSINPMRDGQTWILLGRHRFAGSPASVQWTTSTDLPQRSDAVAFLPVDEPQPLSVAALQAQIQQPSDDGAGPVIWYASTQAPNQGSADPDLRLFTLDSNRTDFFGTPDAAMSLRAGSGSGTGISGSGSTSFASGSSGTVLMTFQTPPSMVNASLFSRGVFASPPNLELFLLGSTGELRLSLAHQQNTVIGTLAANTWYYFAITWDLSLPANPVTWFLGPMQLAPLALSSGKLNATAVGNPAQAIFIAGRPGTAVSNFAGAFQNIAIYDRPLSDSAIRSQFAAIVAAAPAQARISIQTLPGEFQIDFAGGIIQQSADLLIWTDLQPQPASPWSFTIDSHQPRFFRVQSNP